MPPTTIEIPIDQALRAAANILAAALHSATARATELAIKTKDVTIIRQTTALMKLMTCNLNEEPARLAKLRRES